MKIDFENLGNIEKGLIELNDFTIFCGQNNSGKTYAMYSIYGLFESRHRKYNFFEQKQDVIRFDFFNKIIEDLKENKSARLNLINVFEANKEYIFSCINSRYEGFLPKLFGVKRSDLQGAKVSVSFDSVTKIEPLEVHVNGALSIEAKINGDVDIRYTDPESSKNYIPDDILNYFLSDFFVSAVFPDLKEKRFLLPAERSGLNLIYKELFSIRNVNVQSAQLDDVGSEFLDNLLRPRYSVPIKAYLQYLHDVSLDVDGSSLFSSAAELIKSNVLNGSYEVNESNDVFFKPLNSEEKLPLHFCSSTVKALFGLVFYLEHIADKGDFLMIDEPELNLHPDNQRQVARVLAQLVNSGLKVIVSTHSDYFVRELNNLIMLKQDFSGRPELQEKYGYSDNELLDSNKVSAYLFDNKIIVEMEKDDEGIIVETFDSVINQLNQSSNDIYFSMQDAKGEIFE